MATVMDDSVAAQAATSVRTWNGVDFPAPGVWVLDKSHTTVEFTARHLMVAKVKGRFAEFAGQLNVSEDPRESTVDVSIAAASVDSRDEQRDGHLRSKDFFDVETYPELTFRGTGVEHVGGTEWKILGELTIKDVTRPVALDAEFLGGVTDPWGGQRVVFSAETRIKREDFGLTWNVALETGGWLVGSEIRIGIEVEAVRQS
jgi:polyisoprenoid-binding protein YceI